MSAPRTYELVYIVSPDATDEQIAAIHTQVEQTTQKLGGTLVKTDNWGRRKLAYEIQHHKEGTYVLEVLEGGGELMKELDRRLKVVDQVIRHLIVRGAARRAADAAAPAGDAGTASGGARVAAAPGSVGAAEGAR